MTHIKSHPFSKLFAALLLGALALPVSAAPNNNSSNTAAAVQFKNNLATDLKLAQGGNAQAQYDVGMRYKQGVDGVKADREQANLWLEKAAKQGHVEAQYQLSQNSFMGSFLESIVSGGTFREEFPEAYTQEMIQKYGAKEAARIIEAKKKSRTQADKKIEERKQKAHFWLTQAAQQGHSKAQTELANQYYQDRDYRQAKTWYDKAAAQGNTHAQYRLGEIYTNGEGVARNVELGKALLEKAALKGYAAAQSALGGVYYHQKNYAQAKAWNEKAAAQGDAEALAGLGLMYENGQGVQQNYATAAAWYKKAADKGHEGAKWQLDELRKGGYIR